jgi:hemolysin III
VDDRPILQRSLNTERALSLPRPRMRGRSHLLAALAAVPASAVWIATTPAGRPRVAIAAFAIGITLMLCLSAALHLRPWSPRIYERLFRLDHTGIYLAIGGTGVGLALLGLEGWPGRVLLGAAIVGVGIGIVVEWLPFAPPRGFSNAVYLTLGWLPVVLLPWLWITAGWTTIALLLVGGALYTAGAIIVGLRRPDPVPLVFGYHEVFHLLVLAAAASHAWMLARLVPPVG